MSAGRGRGEASADFTSTEGRYAGRVVELRVVHGEPHPVRRKGGGGEGPQQGLQIGRRASAGVEPLRRLLGTEDDRHAVVDRGHEVVWLRREEGARPAP